MRRNSLLYIYALFGSFLLVSCGSVKDITYMQGDGLMMRTSVVDTFELKVQIDDILNISVQCLDDELSKPFNMQSMFNANTANGNYQQQQQGFLVDKDGFINYPVLGRIQVAGLTCRNLVNLLQNRLSSGGYIKDPIVTVRFQNFRITVLGEVSRPGTYNVDSEHITLFQALGQAGDLTLYGRRDRVAVVREEAGGKRTILYHDLRSIDVMQSPFFYLKQNDLIYVEPNRVRGEASSQNQFSNVGTWMSMISFLSTIGVLIFK